MHELSIAMALVEMASEKLETLGAVRVEALHLRLGPLSGRGAGRRDASWSWRRWRSGTMQPRIVEAAKASCARTTCWRARCASASTPPAYGW